MTQDIQIGGDIVTLDSEKLYSGMDNPQGEEKLVQHFINSSDYKC